MGFSEIYLAIGLIFGKTSLEKSQCPVLPIWIQELPHLLEKYEVRIQELSRFVLFKLLVFNYLCFSKKVIIEYDKVILEDYSN